MSAQNHEVYDLAIIGGGIAGAGIARDAALRGIRTVLFEKNKFGSGTSSRSSRLIHGGIRYLELAWLALLRGRFKEAWENFHFVFVSLKESRFLEKIAPPLVKPIALVIPLYKNQGRHPLEVYLGAYLYAFLAFLGGGARWPEIFSSREAILKVIPSLRKDDLQGGIKIWDHTTDDMELVKAVMASAIKNGVATLERSKVLSYRLDPAAGHFIIEIETGGAQKTFLAKKLINASGPWIDHVRRAAGETKEDFIVPVAGAHLTFKEFTPESVILQAQDKRIFFVVNHDGVSRVGTTERYCNTPDVVEVTQEETDYLIKSLRYYFPGGQFGSQNILSRDAGVRPLAKPEGGLPPNAIPREHKIRREDSGALSAIGVKLTDHRRAAEEIVDIVARELGINKKSVTAKTPL